MLPSDSGYLPGSLEMSRSREEPAVWDNHSLVPKNLSTQKSFIIHHPLVTKHALRGSFHQPTFIKVSRWGTAPSNLDTLDWDYLKLVYGFDKLE